MTIEQMLENNLKEFLMLIIALIVLFFVLPKVLVLIIKISSKIYETFFMGDNVIQISDYKGKIPDSKVVGRKTIIRDADGRIISEETEGIDNELIKKIEEQVMKGECISDDGIIVNKKGHKIADFGTRENFEEFKQNQNNCWEELPSSGHSTVRFFSEEIPQELKDDLEKYGSILIKKDQYGNITVKDKNGNILEGREKEDALEARKRIDRYQGTNVQEKKMTKEEIEELLKSKGILNNNESVEDLFKNKGFVDSDGYREENIKQVEDIKGEIREEAKRRMNNEQIEIIDVIEEKETEEDDAGITRY